MKLEFMSIKVPIKVPIEARLEYALHIAFEAEHVILASYQDPLLRVDTKSDNTIVTEADREAERKMRELIACVYPEDAIIGEEAAAKSGTSGYSWILDPIDGTVSYACGVPLFGTLIGLTYHGKPVAGVAHMPALKETYYGSIGEGAWWRPASATSPVRAQVSKTARMSEALFTTTSEAGFIRAKRKALFTELMSATRKFRGWGSCYGHLLVATGRADFMVEPSLSVWDCAALAPIVTEAGGKFFDINGNDGIDGGSGISCNALIADELKSFLNRTSLASDRV